jgi:hypothetical protein
MPRVYISRAKVQIYRYDRKEGDSTLPQVDISDKR